MNRQSKLFSYPFMLLMVVSLLVAFGFSMVMTLISAYSVSVGANLTIAGMLGGIFSLTALVIRPISGVIADSKNRKTLCMISTLVISLAIIGYAYSFDVPSLLFFRVLHGAAFGISGTANMALVSEYIPEDRMAEGIGYFGMGHVLSQIIGPNIGIFIRDIWGYRPLFILIAVMTVSAVLLLALLPYKDTTKQNKQNKHKQTGLLSSLIAKESLVYALIGGVFSLGNGVINAFLVLIGDERQITHITLFFSVNAFVLLFLRLFIGRLIDRKGLSLVVNIALIASFAAMLMIGFASALPMVLAASVFKAFGQGGGQISLQSACIKRVDAARVGVATSTYYIGADIGQGLGPIIGGRIASQYSYSVMFSCVALVILVATVAFNLYQRKERLTDKMIADNLITDKT